MRQKVEEFFGIDLRSLAVFRISIALLILIDLVIRAADLSAHYTDAGVLPRAALPDLLGRAGFLSLHAMSGSSAWQALLFICAACFAVALLLGYRTWFATAASWVLLASLQIRNPLINNGGDTVLRLMLFWSLFVPLGACWSLERVAVRSTPHPSPRILSVGTAALLLQGVFIYVFAALLKFSDPAWHKGTALFYTLHSDKMTTGIGHWLGTLTPEVLTLGTRAVNWFELLAPVGFFIPVCTGPFRLITVLVFALLQLGFGLSLELGLFPWISAAALIPFLPTWFWEKWVKAHATHRDSSAATRWLAGTSRISGPLAALLLAYTLLLNFESLNHAILPMPKVVGWIGKALQIKQRWGMFTDLENKDDAWMIIPGHLADGTTIDLALNGGPLIWDKPPLVSARFKNVRWAAYDKNVWVKRSTRVPKDYARSICRRWNADHSGGKHLERLEIVAMVERTAEPQAEPQRVQLIQHACSGV